MLTLMMLLGVCSKILSTKRKLSAVSPKSKPNQNFHFFDSSVTKHQGASSKSESYLKGPDLSHLQILLQGMDFWRVLLHSKQLHRLYVRGGFRLQPRGHRYGQVGYFM